MREESRRVETKDYLSDVNRRKKIVLNGKIFVVQAKHQVYLVGRKWTSIFTKKRFEFPTGRFKYECVDVITGNRIFLPQGTDIMKLNKEYRSLQKCYRIMK